MTNANQPARLTERTEQYIQNLSWDERLQLLVFLQLESDGTNAVKKQTSLMATKVTEVGTTIYFAQAPIGTAQSAAAWQARKIDTSGSDTVFTWADGDGNFDNVATDLTALTYS